MDPIRVLLIEDNPTDVLLLQESLAEVGGVELELIAVGRLADALERLIDERFDAILSDMGLPDSQGLDVVKQLRDQVPTIPIVVLTGLQDEAVGLRAVRDGAQDWLVKGQATATAVARSIRYAIERKEAEGLRIRNEQLSELSRQLWQTARLATMGELAASIAHELNNPLQIVTLRLERLFSQTHEGDPMRRDLEILLEEAERMASLVARLLEHSRGSTQQISTIEVAVEIENTLDLVDYHLRSRGITVVRDFALPVPAVHADRQQLRQVFLNLFTNASDAMPTGGTLTVRVEVQPRDKLEAAHELEGDASSLNPDQGFLVVEIADTGVGIPRENLPRATEPFFTTKEDGRGTGLGLAICQRILQEHRGRLTIASAPGTGTTVRLLLPIASHEGVFQ